MSTQCPAWHQFIIPVLEFASTQKLTRKAARAQIPQLMQLSPEVIEQRLNSGPRRVDNRTAQMGPGKEMVHHPENADAMRSAHDTFSAPSVTLYTQCVTISHLLNFPK